MTEMRTIDVACITGAASIAGALVGIGIWAGAYGATIDNADRRLNGHDVRLDVHAAQLGEIRETLADIKASLRFLVRRTGPGDQGSP